MQTSLDQVTGQTGQDNGVGVRLRELERANAANKTLYDNFMSRTKITQEQASFEEREARVISPPPSQHGLIPQKGSRRSFGRVVGLLFGVGGAVALDMLNSGFSTARELEDKLGYPVLASVPLLADKDRKIDDKSWIRPAICWPSLYRATPRWCAPSASAFKWPTSTTPPKSF